MVVEEQQQYVTSSFTQTSYFFQFHFLSILGFRKRYADISPFHLDMRSVDDISFKKEEEREIWNGV